jgi:hypothetical protein
MGIESFQFIKWPLELNNGELNNGLSSSDTLADSAATSSI